MMMRLERLRIRAEAFVSDPELVTDLHLQIAASEADDLAGNSDFPVWMDIAFYRYLLLVERNGGIDEEQLKAYRHALSQVSDPNAVENRIRTKPTVKVRANPYL